MGFQKATKFIYKNTVIKFLRSAFAINDEIAYFNDHFGGIPAEILFDNMKTAFLYNESEGKWQVNIEMAAFAAHYGFSPRRCRAYRPKAKGTFKRKVHYIRTSFLPSIGSDLSKIPTYLNLILLKILPDKTNTNLRYNDAMCCVVDIVNWLCRSLHHACTIGLLSFYYLS